MANLFLILPLLMGICSGIGRKIPPNQIPDGETLFDENELKYHVAIFEMTTATPPPKCSGVLVKSSDSNHPPIVLTATSCFAGFTYDYFYVQNDETDCYIYQIIAPFKNIANIYENDLAALILDENCQIDPKRAISINLNDPPTRPFPSVVVTGWDVISGDYDIKILKDIVDVLDDKECLQKFPSENLKDSLALCMGVKDKDGLYQCEAQRGSPVVTDTKNPVLLAVTSWTYEPHDQSKYPCVATDVSKPDVINFLKQIFERESL